MTSALLHHIGTQHNDGGLGIRREWCNDKTLFTAQVIKRSKRSRHTTLPHQCAMTGVRQAVYGKRIHNQQFSIAKPLSTQRSKKLTKKLHQAGDSTATVTDAVLILGRHLGEGTTVTLNRLEDAVIAKASSAVALGENNTLDLTLE